MAETHGQENGHVLRLSGSLTIAQAEDTSRLLEEAFTSSSPPRAIDIGAVTQIDTVGAWLLHRRLRDNPDLSIENAGEMADRLMAEVAAADKPVKIHADEAPFVIRELSRLGSYIVNVVTSAGELLAFLGATIAAGWRAIRRPQGLRANAIAVQMEQAGINALGIVGLMSFLIGIVIAQQGAVQLKQFGAESYVVNLIGRLTFRELGIVLTAIMVAGRSASAFAAQIGSMKLAEEVDAMRTMGLDPMQTLVIPRVIGLILVMPILNFFACVTSIIGGGLFCWISMDMAPSAYAQRIREVVLMEDFLHGMIKAPVFAAIIAVIGCFQGFQVTGNAESVGTRTTTAVVQSIFMVIVLDAFFAVFFTVLGFG